MNGNRLALLVDRGNNGTVDETTGYVYDVNDRLLTETAGSQQSTYAYNHTEQISKTTVDTSTQETLASVAFTWTPDDRMASITTTEYASGAPVSARRTAYAYDDGGVRVSAKISLDSTASGTFTHSTTTQYLNDGFNPTGYSQVIQETTTDATGSPLSKTVYSFGAKRIGQTVYDATNPTGLSSFYLMDGHGSTRVLTDAIGAIMTIGGVRQIFVYDAHGNMVNLESSAAGTTIQYNGEQFDWQTGFLNLRRRLYDAQAGRFLGSDPYGGREDNPQTFHKYAFTHGDPVNGRDPSGNMLILMDGTSNDREDEYEGKWVPTNIYKLHRLSAVVPDPNDPDYDPLGGYFAGDYFYGVGSDPDNAQDWTWIGGVLGNGYGQGTAARVDEAMNTIRWNHDYLGDHELNVIGFSRGAVEALEITRRVEELWPDVNDMKINFVGLFDPVSSLGYAGQFSSTVRGQLASRTQHAWQAIASGENRNNFAAVFVPGANYRWFPGNHGDVGGGWGKHGLADRCLKWMYDHYLASNPNVALQPLASLAPDLYSPNPTQNQSEDHSWQGHHWYHSGSLSWIGGGGFSSEGAGNRMAVEYNPNAWFMLSSSYRAVNLWDTTQGVDRDAGYGGGPSMRAHHPFLSSIIITGFGFGGF